jgi:hypothetical protein
MMAMLARRIVATSKTSFSSWQDAHRRVSMSWWVQWRKRQTVATGLDYSEARPSAAAAVAVRQVRPSYKINAKFCHFRFLSIFYHIWPFFVPFGFIHSALILAFFAQWAIFKIDKCYALFLCLCCSRFYLCTVPFKIKF